MYKSNKTDTILQEYLFFTEVETVIEKINNTLEFKETEKFLDFHFKSVGEIFEIPPIMFFKMLLLGRWFGLSEVRVIYLVNNRPDIRKFIGEEIQKYHVDDIMLIYFEIRLRETGVLEDLFELAEKQLKEKNLQISLTTNNLFCLSDSFLKNKINGFN